MYDSQLLALAGAFTLLTSIENEKEAEILSTDNFFDENIHALGLEEWNYNRSMQNAVPAFIEVISSRSYSVLRPCQCILNHLA